MSDTRIEMLRRIRACLHDVPAAERPADVAVSRTYRQHSELDRDDLINRFVERVAEYRATVWRVPENELPRAIAAACGARSVRVLVVPADLPPAWVPGGIEIAPDGGLTYAQLDQSDGVLTGCAVAIAETGTIILDHAARQGRRVLTLLPDYHLCVVYAHQIVGSVPEALHHINTSESRTRPITLVSGPSATSDIELNRVEGVHGPRTLEVLVVVDA